MRQSRVKRMSDSAPQTTGTVALRLSFLRAALADLATLQSHDKANCPHRSATLSLIPTSNADAVYQIDCRPFQTNATQGFPDPTQLLEPASFINFDPTCIQAYTRLIQILCNLAAQNGQIDVATLQPWGSSCFTLPLQSSLSGNPGLDNLFARWQLPDPVQQDLIFKLQSLLPLFSEFKLNFICDGSSINICLQGFQAPLANLASTINSMQRRLWPTVVIGQSQNGELQWLESIALRDLLCQQAHNKLLFFAWLKQLSGGQKLPMRKAS